jgi:hypothetical protein
MTYSEPSTDLSTDPDDFAGAPHRPPGLLLAILTVGLIYGIGPLIPVVMSLFVNSQGGGINAELPNVLAWLNVIVSLVTLFVCVLAYRGQPFWIRWVLIGIVWTATIVQYLSLLRPSTGDSGGGIDFSASVVSICQFALTLLVPAYMTWYLNRAPARAFYRAY